MLSSLYTTNAADWQCKVGGLVARRVFPMICSREIELDTSRANEIRNRLSSIREGRHIIVTVPEHRLSLENKAIEMCSTGQCDAAVSLLDIIHELALHARDFVDESDEIASPKYQLVYPLGNPQEMDGVQVRWLLHAAALQSVSRHAGHVFEKYGTETVEVIEMQSNSYIYNAIRLLESPQLAHAYKELCDLVLSHILKGTVP